MKVGIIAFLQESNTFLPGKTTYAHFEQDMLVEGEDVRRRMANTFHEVGGMFAGLAEEKVDAVPIFAGRALPYGAIVAEAYDKLVAKLLAALDRTEKLDGLLVAPHGATVAENHPDADGYWLGEVRKRVGDKMPVIGTLDPHANLSADMVRATDALIAYRSNPHLDQKQRGIDAAKLMARTVRGEVKPAMAAHLLPMAVNIERQGTPEPHCRGLYGLADEQLKRSGVLSNSVILGFPYADVAEMGSAVIAVADKSELAGKAADELGGYWWDHRQEFIGQMIPVKDAVDRAEKLDGPITLLDMGDNAGGGSPGDGTHVAQELHRRKLGPSFVCLADPDSQAKARAAGIGTKLRLAVGAKTDDQHGKPIEGEFTVRGLFDGIFKETVARHGGFTDFDQGPTAVVESDTGLTVMLTTKRMVPFSIAQLTTFGLDPAKFRILVAKGVHAPVAAYAPVSKHLIRVDTPGSTSADLHRLTYHHRRKPMVPFEMTTSWDAAGSRVWGHGAG